MPDTAFLLTAFATLFVIVDPVALVPLFIPLTRGMTAAQRRRIALRACLVAAGVLTVFGLVGDNLLKLIGISMPAFRIAGGVLLFLTALDMLFERRTRRREDKTHPAETHELDDPSVFPLAVPLIAGPGAIASMILLTGQAGGGWAGFAVVQGVMLAVIAATFVLFLLAAPLERALGRTGTLVVTRVLGMLLAALAVQFIIDGIRGTGLIG
jgi:multiple antibiotic resistance protein